MWDTSLVLKFQLTKTYFGRARDREKFITYLSLGGYYPQDMLKNIEG